MNSCSWPFFQALASQASWLWSLPGLIGFIGSCSKRKAERNMLCGTTTKSGCTLQCKARSKLEKRKRSQYLASSQSRWYQYPACRHFSRRANLVQSCSSLANELLNFVKRQLIAGACIFLPSAVWWVGYLRYLNELSSLKHSKSTLATKLQSHFQVPWFGLTSMCNLLSLSCLILFGSVRFCSILFDSVRLCVLHSASQLGQFRALQ